MRYPAIENTFFIKNRKKLSDKLEPGSIALVYSNFQMPRNGDQYFAYRQNSDFFYLTGIDQEKSILLLAPDAGNSELKEVLFILESNALLEIWEGHKYSPKEASNLSGILTIRKLSDFDSVLHSLLTESENLYFNIPEFPKFSPELKTKDAVRAGKIKEKYPLHNYFRLAPILHNLRLIKSDEEIKLMRQASAITHDAFSGVLAHMKPGMKEYEIEALISYEFTRQGALAHAYAPIVASGKNACVLHYIENHDVCRNGDLVLLDFGAEYANYAADLSRTIPSTGKFSKRQRQVYDATLRIFKTARSLMLPGTTINRWHDEVCKLWEEEHINLGLYSKIEADKNRTENPLWFNYYMHGTGHFLGLDVHDVGTKDTPLEAGMVITCEPAIYIAAENLGIRIENNILITEDGNEDLMEGIPIEALEIEELMQG